ncbi:hypothetical protein ACTPOK_11480 [Streptomyces inhibens]
MSRRRSTSEPVTEGHPDQLTGIDPNSPDTYGDTALRWAVEAL